jgi:predicted aspartyl protease
MIQLPFHPEAHLLIFPRTIEYQDVTSVLLVLDTGASTTTIRESTLRDIGYPPEALTDLVPFSDASQSHLVPRVTLKSFILAGAEVENLEVLAYTIPEEYGIYGVIGLNFLRYFNLNLSFEQGSLTLERFNSGQ